MEFWIWCCGQNTSRIHNSTIISFILGSEADKQVVLAAVAQNSSALKHTLKHTLKHSSATLWADKEFVLASGSHLYLSRVPYVLYRVIYIDPVSLLPAGQWLAL